ncbi:MAG: iron-containing alcohol dehydrogenase, partial [Candidatus Wenzhouxiangella sp. M2_3B_020]
MAAFKVLGALLPAPRPMLFVGADSMFELNRAMARFGVRHAFIVTDAVLVELGVVEPAVECLRSLDIRVTVFDRVQPDPDYEQVENGAAELESAGCDAVLAIGGGSAIDAAKVIAAKVTSKKPVARLTGILKLKAPTLPL